MITRKQHIIHSFIYLFLISSILPSCGIFKKSTNINDSTEEKIIKKEIQTTLDSIQFNYLAFETFYSGFTGNFEENDKSLPLKGIIKIKKDTFIQISIRPTLGIELFKIMIDQDSIKILDRTKHEYLLIDYIFLQKKFGVEINFEIIQSILTNKYFVYPKEEDIFNYILTSNTSINNDKKYLIFTNICKFKGKKANHTIIFSQNNLKLISNIFNINELNSSISILYSGFNKLKKVFFPKNIQIKLFENQIKFNISIKYKNISLNKSLNYNFIIPENYKSIKFE